MPPPGTLSDSTARGALVLDERLSEQIEADDTTYKFVPMYSVEIPDAVFQALRDPDLPDPVVDDDDDL